MDGGWIVVEKILLLILLGLAVVYVYRHMKNKLIIGEKEEKCHGCPVEKIVSHQNHTK